MTLSIGVAPPISRAEMRSVRKPLRSNSSAYQGVTPALRQKARPPGLRTRWRERIARVSSHGLRSASLTDCVAAAEDEAAIELSNQSRGRQRGYEGGRTHHVVHADPDGDRAGLELVQHVDDRRRVQAEGIHQLAVVALEAREALGREVVRQAFARVAVLQAQVVLRASVRLAPRDARGSSAT